MELLLVNPNLMNRVMYDAMRDMDRVEKSIFPYWRNADHSVLHVGNDTVKVHIPYSTAVDDDKKFAVSLDVSQFRPEELNVHLDGRVLTIEGKQEHKTKNSSMHRSFTRKWLLPENVDLDAVRTQVDDKGHLSVDAPKHIEGHPKKRRIPITAAAPSASSAAPKK
ncbi:Hsp20/alpha crystallin family protein [Teladorsagia circumcincta]|uniref:Hsp20/alpha crystallin family protein n=1 Tax=Teladorsagia circumcincta TaxID=45464 RepID=A0A2G9TMN4_TELCI|nr:Hsp20/alpha crystallin family protein [Teladorsagia circumcincta]